MDFAQSTSVKGVSRAVRTGSLCLRFMWIIALFFGFGIAIFLLCDIFGLYIANETVTNIDEVNHKPTFPDVTVCNLNPFLTLEDERLSINDYFKFLNRFSNVSKERVKDIFGENTTKLELDELRGKIVSIAGFHQNSHPSVNESKDSVTIPDPFILSCKWYDWMWGEITYGNATHNCSDAIQAFRSPDYVLCYTIKVPETVRDTDVRGLTLVLYLNENVDGHIPRFHPNLGFSIAAGARVSIQAPGVMPDNKKGISVSPGHETTIRLETTEYERRVEPRGTCSDTTYAGHADEKVKYSESICTEMCFQTQIINHCKCIDAMLPHTSDHLHGYPYCGAIPNIHHFVHNTKANGSEGNTSLEEAFRQMGRNTLCAIRYVVNTTACQASCLQPCREKTYRYSVSQAVWPHPAYSLALFERMAEDNPTLNQRFLNYTALVKRWRDQDEFQVTETGDGSLEPQGPNPTGFGPPPESTLNQNPTQVDTDQAVRDLSEELAQLKGINNNFLQLKILFGEANSIKIKQGPKITVASALGNVGGVMNLWIGITFMTLVELCELCFKIVTAWKRPVPKPDQNTNGEAMREMSIASLDK